MENTVVFALIALVLAIGVLSVVLVLMMQRMGRDRSGGSQEKWLEALQGQIGSISEQLLNLSQSTSQSLQDVTKGVQDSVLQTSGQVNKRLDESGRLLGDLKEQLASLEGSSQHIVELGKDVSSLNDLLRSPKLRGQLGETMLEQILSQVLPKNIFELQYRFSDNSVVDAIVRLGDKLVPIDSKFPLDNYQRA
ncbi:MAG: DNA recombination protein RmuC, partial [bacterium]